VEPLLVRAAREDQGLQTIEFKDGSGNVQIVCDFSRRPNVSHLGSDLIIVNRLEVLAPLSMTEFTSFLDEFQGRFADDCYQVMFFNVSKAAAEYLKGYLGEPSRVGLECKLTPTSHTDPSQYST
jgi:hypothetical protein